jgi:lysophospholipase L1-like esterase
MKSFKVAAAVLVLIFITISSAETLISPNNSNINYYGRFDFSNSATQVKFNWPAAVIEASFTGPSIGVELTDGGGYCYIEIDGVLVDSLSPSSVTHRTIRTNLSTSKQHTIRVIAITSGATYSFRGFYLADGKTITTPPAKPVRKMEFIGDSWTAGDVISETDGMPYSWKYFNAALTFARVTSTAFKAQDILVARGGTGMVRSNGGAATMPARYQQTMCDVAGNWNFSSWIPDVVVIFLGINDGLGNATGGVVDSIFVKTYSVFLTTVRSHYPDVPIILVSLPGRINAAAQKLTQSFPKVYIFKSPITLANAKAMFSHPNVAQNHEMADSLIPVVMKATGWDTTASPITGIMNVKTPGAAIVTRNVFASVQDEITLPQAASGIGEITAYDCCGKVIGKIRTCGKTTFHLNEFGIAQGMVLYKYQPIITE